MSFGVFFMYWRYCGFPFHFSSFSFSRSGIPDTKVNRMATNIGEITLSSSQLWKIYTNTLDIDFSFNDIDSVYLCKRWWCWNEKTSPEYNFSKIVWMTDNAPKSMVNPFVPEMCLYMICWCEISHINILVCRFSSEDILLIVCHTLQ